MFVRRLSAVVVMVLFLLPAHAVDCARHQADVVSHIVCRVDLRREVLSLHHADEKGRVYGSLPALRATLAKRGERVIFAMNAGMFHADHRPVGLLILAAREIAPINRASASGNFYLQPNGVFLIDEQGPAVVATHDYRNLRPDWATQSGPMLVYRGIIPDLPAFRAGSRSRFIRNGVCVPSAGQVAFVISEAPVTFRQFAEFFAGTLRCQHALYLDGSISSVFAPALGRDDSRAGLGPLFAVVEKPAVAKAR